MSYGPGPGVLKARLKFLLTETGVEKFEITTPKHDTTYHISAREVVVVVEGKEHTFHLARDLEGIKGWARIIDDGGLLGTTGQNYLVTKKRIQKTEPLKSKES